MDSPLRDMDKKKKKIVHRHKLRDIDYLFDTKLFNGKRAIGLDEDNQ